VFKKHYNMLCIIHRLLWYLQIEQVMILPIMIIFYREILLKFNTYDLG